MINIKRKYLINSIKRVFNTFGFSIIRTSTLEELTANTLNLSRINKQIFSSQFIELMLNKERSKELVNHSKSQIHQDIFVLNQLKFKENGFYVEFGATNGIDLSNSYLLEKKFNWKGILAEPANCWQTDLLRNRNANIDNNCVWSESGLTLIFNEVENAELSTIKQYSEDDFHKKSRISGKKYSVNTISLYDLLIKHRAPNIIDYLSIDTEGSEYEILKSFNFDTFKFKIITIEHNYTFKRDDIYTLLTSKGYVRIYSEISQFDDWYIRPDLID